MNAGTIRLRPLPYQRSLAARPLSSIDLLVIHCTELPDLAMAREYGERVLYPKKYPNKNPDNETGTHSGTGNSGHFYVDRDDFD